GILVFEGGNTVRDNTASYNLGDGIHTSTSTSEFGGPGIESSLISNNTVVGNLHNGIDIDFSENVVVKNNTVTGNSCGIRLSFSRDCSIISNVVSGSSGGSSTFWRSGIVLESGTLVHGCSVTQNTVSGSTWDGLEAGDDSYNNSFDHNSSLGSGRYDAEDLTL